MSRINWRRALFARSQMPDRLRVALWLSPLILAGGIAALAGADFNTAFPIAVGCSLLAQVIAEWVWVSRHRR